MTVDRHASIAAAVAKDGWSVCRDFLSREEAVALRARLKEWWEEGELRRAGIGRGETFQVRDDIRGDYVRWLDFSVGGRFSAFLDEHIEPLRLAVNREMFLGVCEFEGHVTVYPPGAHYRRHLDQFKDAAHRKLSVILYLNDDDWSANDGGELRMFLPKDDGEEIIDVLPEGGTLVAFLSHEIPHEVLETKRERYSLTGWFRTRE
ncbi:MAG TPA: 2OG-Fe(II) oxygenase [Gammaproteobacteria bacterium]